MNGPLRSHQILMLLFYLVPYALLSIWLIFKPIFFCSFVKYFLYSNTILFTTSTSVGNFSWSYNHLNIAGIAQKEKNEQN